MEIRKRIDTRIELENLWLQEIEHDSTERVNQLLQEFKENSTDEEYLECEQLVTPQPRSPFPGFCEADINL